MKKRHIFLLIIFCIISACNYQGGQQQYKIPISDSTILKEYTIEVQETKLDTSLMSILKSLNANAIKNEHGRGSTSTFLPKEYSKNYFRPDTGGFFGLYYLVNNDINVRLAYKATLVIYAKKKPWKADNPDEILIEFTSFYHDVGVLNNLKVGDKKEAVVKQFGEPKFVKDNVFFYQDDEGVVLSFKFSKNNIVEAYKLGHYKKIDIEKLADDIISKFV
ncbi:MAG: hypothetical protein ACOCXH_16140 [Cyclobacteriaceae bacterium]